MKAYFEQRAAYNRWANARLYEAALALSDADYRRDVGAFFKSLHGTLNHLLLTDRMWFKRLTGDGDHPNKLDAIMHEDRKALATARADEDDRIVRYVASLSAEALGRHAQLRDDLGSTLRHRSDAIFSRIFSITRRIIVGRPT